MSPRGWHRKIGRVFPPGTELLPEKPGIYLIRCKVTGEKYVGGSMNIQRRVRGHFRNKRNWFVDKLLIRKAIIKHGPRAFEVSVLELCDSRWDVPQREFYWYCKLRPELCAAHPVGRRDRIADHEAAASK